MRLVRYSLFAIVPGVEVAAELRAVDQRRQRIDLAQRRLLLRVADEGVAGALDYCDCTTGACRCTA